MHRTLLAATGAAVVFSGCAESDWVETDTAAIIGGAADTGDPAVGYLFSVIGNQGAACSGTLISPRVVLTAAHCLDLDGTPTMQSVYFGTSRGSDPGQIETIDVIDRIWFEPWSLNGNDIGMVLLEHDAMTPPVEINRTDLGAGDVGDPIRLVGWGQTSDSGGAGNKRQVTTPLTGFHNPNVLRYGNSGSNTCEGDSGGPGFMMVGGREVIAGITSFGFAGCMSDSGSTNVARYVNFIDSWVADHDVAMSPETAIIRPADGATVAPGFAIQVDATDDSRIERVELLIDGEMIATGTLAPYVFNAPELGEGDVAIEARAYDNRGAMTSDTVTVTVSTDAPCTGADCPEQDSGGCSTTRGPHSALALALALLAVLSRAGRRRRRE